MRAFNPVKLALVLLLGLAATDLFAAITVTPAAPTSSDSVVIRLENSFSAEARVGSATINQAGNAFVIQQTVEIACSLPSDPLVTSNFSVGLLAPGTYTVTANITFDGFFCSRPPITQTTTFVVAPAIPTLTTGALFLLAAALAGIAVLPLTSPSHF